MVESLQQLLGELEEFGEANDSSITDRSRPMLNISRDTCEFLSVLVRAMHAQQVFEIGTSNGHSTLWLASAAHPKWGECSLGEGCICRNKTASVGTQGRYQLELSQVGKAPFFA